MKRSNVKTLYKGDDIMKNMIKEIVRTRDDDNPDFLLNGISTSLLLQLAKKEIDIEKIIKQEISNRGLNQDGKWIGLANCPETLFT